MNEQKRHRLNAPGPFYVVDGICFQCCVPEGEAPGLMGHCTNPSEQSCYFKKQPKTPEEFEKAIAAVNSSCIQALRYSGTDPGIIKKLDSAVCDNEHLLDRKPWWKFW